jgi:PAS domain S-box-containing protein
VSPPIDDRFHRRQDLLTLALHAAHLGAWEIDLGTGENAWHAGMAELVGVAPERGAAEGRRFLDYVHPQDRAAIVSAFEEARRDVRPGARWEGDFRIVRADGVQRWLNSRGMTVIRDDGRACMVGCAQDITDRKLWEERIAEQAQLIDLASDAMVVRTPDGRILEWNQGAEEMYGYRREEAVGSTIHDLLHTEFPAPLADIEAALQHDGRWSGELRHTRRDGAHITVFARWVLERGGAGKSARVLETDSDITERAESERRLRESEAGLREADRRKDEFLATLAHELRNPLAPIRNAAQLLRDPHVDESRRRSVVDMLDRQVRQMVRLVDDLLEVGRITTGKLNLLREEVDLRAAIDQAIEATRPHDAHPFSATLPAEPILVDGDPARLTQVFSNLLGNAVKYTPRGKAIAIEACEGDGEAVVTVSDEGIGIAPDALMRLFEMFSQIDPHLHRHPGGLGVGLAVARVFVELHGGAIEAHSEGAGRGSRFVVRLPLASG